VASFLQNREVLDPATNGSVSRLGAFVTTRTLNQAAGVAEGLLLAPSGSAGQECISPTTEAGVKTAVGFSVYRPMSEDFDATHHYADNEAVGILESGHMYLNSEGTVVADKPVFARIVSDGSANTVLGKVRGDSDYPAGGVVITPAASLTAAVTTFSVRLSDGTVDETFNFTSDSSPIAAEVAAGLVALIDASLAFQATGTTTISVTSTSGIVDVLGLASGLTITTPARAIRVPGTFFDAARTGAGLVEIRRNKIN
jgi:hypothetical protein